MVVQYVKEVFQVFDFDKDTNMGMVRHPNLAWCTTFDGKKHFGFAGSYASLGLLPNAG